MIKYLKDYALDEITELIKDLAKRNKFKYQQITVEDLDDSWDDCLESGVLSYNWRIIFAPIPVFHYLVVKQLCRLKETYNEEKYWNLVAKISPDYQISKFWLTKYGSDLYK